MSDTPQPPEPSPAVSGAPAAPEHDLEVDLAAFLPEGTSLADDADDADDADGIPTAVAADDDDTDAGGIPTADVTGAGDLEAVTDDGAEAEHAGSGAPTPGPAAPKEPPVDLAALGQIEADLGAVDAALLALDQGRYGSCTACDRPIDDALLAADPVRATCEAHAPA